MFEAYLTLHVKTYLRHMQYVSVFRERKVYCLNSTKIVFNLRSFHDVINSTVCGKQLFQFFS